MDQKEEIYTAFRIKVEVRKNRGSNRRSEIMLSGIRIGHQNLIRTSLSRESILLGLVTGVVLRKWLKKKCIYGM